MQSFLARTRGAMKNLMAKTQSASHKTHAMPHPGKGIPLKRQGGTLAAAFVVTSSLEQELPFRPLRLPTKRTVLQTLGFGPVLRGPIPDALDGQPTHWGVRRQ